MGRIVDSFWLRHTPDLCLAYYCILKSWDCQFEEFFEMGQIILHVYVFSHHSTVINNLKYSAVNSRKWNLLLLLFILFSF